MSDEVILRVTGEVQDPLDLTFADLCQIPEEYLEIDVSRIIAGRQGDAVKLAALLRMANAEPAGRYLGLHGTADNFHASIPLEPVEASGLLIFRKDGAPLRTGAGGPVRFFIPDFAACHTAEIDECANVKFVDHIEITAEKGHDNRPSDDAEHEALHDNES